MIYTSGSTGKPKGVAVPHDGIASLVATARERMGVDEHSRVLHFASLGFDVAVFEISMALCSGAQLVLVPDEARAAGSALTDLIAERGVTHAILPPALLSALPPECAMPEGLVVLVGTETVPPELIRRWAGHLRLFAAYGLTEATVNSTLWPAVPDWDRAVPIGVPDPNTRTYVLDAFLRPVPVGVIGELYVAGRGLASGYLGKPGLTAQRFIANPNAAGERMYRTGDLARWTRVDGASAEKSASAAGVIEYLGRGDDQVKVRGFRVELGEVEAALAALPGVTQAAVAVRREGTTRLDGYVVGDATDAKARLAEVLPEYMIPATITALDGPLPIGPNGKLDRRLLPEPEVVGAAGRAPATPEEVLLAELVIDALGVAGVGMEDDLFAIGLDSLVVIRLVGKLRAAGMRIGPREFFTRRTVAALAAGLTAAAPAVASDGIGAVPPTPALLELVAQPGAVDRFGSPTVVQVPAGTTMDTVLAALDAVVDTHDALRARLLRDTGALVVPPRGSTPASTWTDRVDVTRWSPARVAAGVVATAHALNDDLGPDAGRMIRATWFDAGDAAPGRLLLVIHHAVVDGVSWRVLLDDLAMAARGRPLDPVPTSLRDWAAGLAAEREQRGAEAGFWRELLASDEALPPVQRPTAHGTTVRTTVPVDVTAALLGPVPAALRAGVDDVLLAALALAVGSPLVVGVQSHGRDGTADLSRTVGWLSGLVPARLAVGGLDPAAAVRAVAEHRRGLPGGGAGYRLLPELEQPRVYVNYEGRFRRPEATPWATSVDNDTLFAEWGDDRPSPFALSLVARTVDRAEGSQLMLWWTAPAGGYDEAQLGEMAHRWMDALTLLSAGYPSSDPTPTPDPRGEM